MVYYRKYRPQKIDDLDNKPLRESLFSILSKEPPHAFLFTGPKGLGKTSTARIVAKVVNCEKNAYGLLRLADNKDKKGKKEISISQIEPCNECDQCITITNGTNMDILEIDAASNRGIDEIRDLKEKIRLSPLSASKKVYIIDEVHMLTTEAFNALLKTLEEPPSHAMFILCTTESHKVPPTILSRSFHITFKPATSDELVRSFRRIVEGEYITIDDDALLAIAGLADRGFRDGAKLLEELVAVSNGEKITKEFIEEKYQVSGIKYQVESMLEALEKQDAKKGLEIIQSLVEQGVDFKFFLQQVMEELHRLLLAKVGGQPLDSAQSEESNLKFSLEDIKYLFALFSKAYGEMKYAILPQLPLELGIIEYCTVSEEHFSGSASVDNYPFAAEQGVSLHSLRKQVGTIIKNKAIYGDPTKQESATKRKPAESDIELMDTSPNGEVTKEWLAAFWKSIIEEMKKHNHTIAGILRGCQIKSYDRKILVIQTAYKFHKERLDEMKTKTALLTTCKLLTGKDIAIEVELRK